MHNINAAKRGTLSLCNLRKETLMKRLDFEIVQPEYKYTRTWSTYFVEDSFHAATLKLCHHHDSIRDQEA